MDTCRVTNEYVTTRRGYIMCNNFACNSTTIGNRNISTCLRVKPWTFWLSGPYVAKKCKRMHANNIFMFQFNLLLLHVEPQAPAKHDFDLQPTTNISLFFLPFGGLYYEYFTFLGKIIFVFYKKIFSKPNKFVFQVRWACELLSNCWVEKLAWAF